MAGPEEFDPSERIGGFGLVAIRGALSNIGFGEPRDDVKVVAERLKCGRVQAERVLVSLERRGFVIRGAKKNEWETTQLARRLQWQWTRPRRLVPVIERDESDLGESLGGLASVGCSILRNVKDSDMFEDADLEVGMWTQFEGDQLIELSVHQPDDYDNRYEATVIETSIYIGIEEAKRIVKGLQETIVLAEAEVERRRTSRPRARRKIGVAKPEAANPFKEVVLLEKELERKKRAEATALAKVARAKEVKERKERAALAFTLKELRRK